MGHERGVLLQVSRSTKIAIAVSVLLALPTGASANDKRDDIVGLTRPNDPHYAKLWALSNTGQTVEGSAGRRDADIDAPQAWTVEVGNNGENAVVVAVVDSGIAYDHPDLAPNIWRNPGESGNGRESNDIDDDGNGLVDDWQGYDFEEDDNDPRDLDGHGSHVAGILGARGNNGEGISGVNWNVEIMPLRAFGRDPGRKLRPEDDILKALTYATRNGADVVNGSFVFGTVTTGFLDNLRNIVSSAPDVLFVFGAGNDKGADLDKRPIYPCALSKTLPNVICVGASTNRDQIASFSNVGKGTVDLVAPGDAVYSTTAAFDASFTDPMKDLTNWFRNGTGNTWNIENGTLSDSPGRDYKAGSATSMQLERRLDLSGRIGCSIRFRVNLDLGDGDTFSTLYGQLDGPIFSSGITAQTTNGKWQDLVVPMSGFDDTDTPRNAVTVAFALEADNGRTTGDGVRVDDVRVDCVTRNYAAKGYEYKEGTSMATPQVSGAAALVKAADPSLTPAEIKSAIVDKVDRRKAFGPLTSSGGRLNLFNAVRTTLPTRLTCVADEEVVPSGTPHEITCTATNDFGTPERNVLVEAENLAGANDPDNDGKGGPDSSADYGCSEETNADGRCVLTVPGDEVGSARICAWIDGDAVGNDVDDTFDAAMGAARDGGDCDEPGSPGHWLGQSRARLDVRWDADPAPSPTEPIAFPKVSGGKLQLFTMNSDGSGVTHVSASQSGDSLNYPSWSPDGSKLIYTLSNGSATIIAERASDGTGTATQLVADPAIASHPVYRPNHPGEFAWDSVRAGDFDIYLAPPADGSRHLAFLHFEERHPSFSADGSRVVFESNDEGDRDIYLLNIDANGNPVGGRTNLISETSTFQDTDPDISPDGTKVVFTSTRGGEVGSDIFIVDIATKAITQVTSGSATDTAPSFSPDGTEIVFLRNTLGSFDIYRAEATAAAAVTNLTNSPENEGEPEWGPERP